MLGFAKGNIYNNAIPVSNDIQLILDKTPVLKAYIQKRLDDFKSYMK